MHGKFPSMLLNFQNLLYLPGNIFPMILLHDISGKIPMHFKKTFFHALKETTQLLIGNFSTTANIHEHL
jgi:hypothetical protein